MCFSEKDMKNDDAVLRQQAGRSLTKQHGVQTGNKAADEAHPDLYHRCCFMRARVSLYGRMRKGRERTLLTEWCSRRSLG